MIPAITYGEVSDHLTNWFSDHHEQSIRLLGFLFARPGSPLAKAEVLPNLEYFDRRSGEHVDFYVAGFRKGHPCLEKDDNISVKGIPDRWDWIFSVTKFNQFRQELESSTSWRYSGGVDLILANGCASPDSGKAYVDFTTAVCMNFDEAKKDGLLITVEQFLERVFQYAESATATDPTWGLSDHMGGTIAKSMLGRLLLTLLPKEVAQGAKQATHLIVRDLSLAE